MDYLKACAKHSQNETQTAEVKDAEAREAQEKHAEETIAALQQDVALRSAITLMDEPGEVTGNSVFTLWDSLKTHIPVTKQNAGIYQHLIDSATFAFHLATLQPEIGISPEKAAFTAILHNAGMLLGPSVEYYRKAEISFLLAQRLGIREDIQALMLPLEKYLTPKDDAGKPRIPAPDSPNDPIILDNARYIQETITPGQLMLDMARLLAKRNKETGKLMTWEEIVSLHLDTRSVKPKKLLWPSSNIAWDDIVASRLSESYAIVYKDAAKMLANAGFDHAAIATEIDNTEPDTDDRLEATSSALFTNHLVL